MIGQVEGHQVHRIARDHRKTLVGLSFHATSPNGRFSHGALQIDSKHLSRIEVHGKYMFYVRLIKLKNDAGQARKGARRTA